VENGTGTHADVKNLFVVFTLYRYFQVYQSEVSINPSEIL
jgi:hypothetical protein